MKKRVELRYKLVVEGTQVRIAQKLMVLLAERLMAKRGKWDGEESN